MAYTPEQAKILWYHNIVEREKESKRVRPRKTKRSAATRAAAARAAAARGAAGRFESGNSDFMAGQIFRRFPLARFAILCYDEGGKMRRERQ